ncbi:MAG: phenylalanine--tRNA ligase subunit alpha [Verrucomicrobia bacterium]|nr:phenylalanine--tRNA ligase subunit alpha [Verrucomicrobiota bacterium]
MDQQIEQLRAEALAALASAGDEAALEAVRVKFLGRTGSISVLSEGMKSLSKDDKPRVGKLLNEARNAVSGAIDARKAALEAERDAKALSGIDLTLPGTPLPMGAIHPITQLLDRAIQIFRQMGFALADGPDIETEWHCFDALNTPPDHPARNEQDTFYLPDGRLLRTQTSTVQVRTMEQFAPPVRIIAPGGVYRRDEVDATHLAQFTQIEGLYVDEGVTLGDLKGTIEYFFRELLGRDVQVRMRPHFFPFTEPSFEIDIKAAALGRGDRWLELAGCGMVDPAVFQEMNRKRGDNAYDPEKYTGFAFGFGLDRLAMILNGVSDIRLFTENDVRFLAQYR